jgi:uncharacterized protein (TIGR03083 family)
VRSSVAAMPAIGDIDYLAHVRADSARFAEVLAHADPSLPVPSCPDWTAADLLWHLGEVQLFWGTIAEQRRTGPPTDDDGDPDRPDDPAQLLEFFRASSAKLVTALESTPPETPVWTWFKPDQTAGFLRRRQAHEALIHRLDAELTTGQVTEMDAELAADGVAEVFDCMYSLVPGWAEVGRPGPVGVVSATDTGTRWFVQPGSWSGTSPRTGTEYRDEGSLTLVDSGDPQFSVAGTARDLDAWLWNRPTLGEIVCDGDYGQFVEIIRAGVQ